MSYKTIKFQHENHIARITLARPDAANALNLDMAAELLQVALLCKDDPSVRAVILDAEGKIFCAGGDVLTFAKAGKNLPSTLRKLLDSFHPAVEILSTMNAPVIASVQGMAAGAGLSLMSSCSFVIASENASFTMAYTAIGMTPDGSATYFLPRQIGLRRSEEMMLTNCRLSPEKALEWSLINEIVSESSLAETTQQLAEKLAQGPTLAYGNTRRLLHSSLENDFKQQLDAEAESIIAMGATEDGLNGVASFKEKRKPEFDGE